MQHAGLMKGYWSSYFTISAVSAIVFCEFIVAIGTHGGEVG